MRNLTAGDWFRLEALALEAEEGDGAVEVDDVEGLDDVEGVGDAWVEDAADEGLDKELVSELLLALVSPVVWFSLLLSMGSGGREWWLPRPRSVRRKLWYLESEKNRKRISIKRVLKELHSIAQNNPRGRISWGRRLEAPWTSGQRARRNRNQAVTGSSPTLTTCWICSRSFQVQILGHACK